MNLVCIRRMTKRLSHTMRVLFLYRLVSRLLFTMLVVTVSACTQIATPIRLGPNAAISQPARTETLTLLTLNLAHGRKDSFNQLLVSGNNTRSNLDEIAVLLRKQDADIVALQEADGPSMWSGYFDHVGYLAGAAGYPWDIRSDHVIGELINYGTGLLSRVAFQEVISHDFPKSPPTLRKGFTLGQIQWQPDSRRPPVAVDILSVHLDFSRKRVREQQISDILGVLESRAYPVIILGDFNSDWLATDSVIRRLSECGRTRVFEPFSKDLGTYKSGKHRLDWVLLSADLEFRRYEVLPDIISDHEAVVVEVGYTGGNLNDTNAANKLPVSCH